MCAVSCNEYREYSRKALENRLIHYAPQCAKQFLSAGYNLVYIGLMPNVPYYLIKRAVKHIMHCQGKFHNPEIGCQMPSCFGRYPAKAVTRIVSVQWYSNF